MKRLLITGASGNLGHPLSLLAASRWETTGTYFRNNAVGGGTPVQIDLRDRQAVLALVSRVRPDVIIHAAASDRSEDMARTNALAAQNISEAACTVGSHLIALSTDVIYDGTHPPYDENDPPTPTTPYSRVKADNERFLLTTCPECLIVRTSLIYDLAPENRQVSWMRALIAAGQEVPLFVDEIRQPIWAWNLAEVLLELADTRSSGVLNVAGPQAISRWEYGTALLRALGYDPLSVARPVLASRVAPHRPRDCTLRLDRALSILHTPLLPVGEALQRAREK